MSDLWLDALGVAVGVCEGEISPEVAEPEAARLERCCSVSKGLGGGSAAGV